MGKIRILLVDDDKNFLLSLSEGLRSHNDKYEVLLAGNGIEAIEKLKSDEVNIVVTDLRMPEMDGIELIVTMSRDYPELNIIVMTAYGTSEIENNLKNFGNCQYIEKPLDFNDLVSKIEKGINPISSGFINGISIKSFIQILKMEKKSCTLKVVSRNKKGELFFEQGELFEAISGDMSGLDVALEIISWHSPEIEIVGENKQNNNNINKDIDFLILEAVKRSDELKNKKVQKNESNKMEFEMNVKKLNESIEKLREDLGDSLITMDVWGVDDAQSLGGFNSEPKAVALFNKITIDIDKALIKSGFPSLGDYYTLNLMGGKMIVIVNLGKYQWGMLLDKTKTNLGLLTNVIIPELLDLFEEAVAG